MTTIPKTAVQQDPGSWQLGYRAGFMGRPQQPPPGVKDALAWYSGKIEGGADRRKRKNHAG